MSLKKAIEHKKEHRKEYRGAKSIDRTCRNHGGRHKGAANQCLYCLGNRLYKNNKREQKALEELNESNFETKVKTFVS